MNHYPSYDIIPLHSYQKVAHRFIMTHPYAGLFLDMGLGKACDNDTLLPLPDGTKKRIGDIKKGDVVLSRNGTPTIVTAVYKHYEKKAYEVVLEDNRRFICCDEHLLVVTSDKQNEHVVPLSHLIKNNTITYYLPLCKPIEYKQNNNIINPYQMGKRIAFISKKKDINIPTSHLYGSVAQRKLLLKGILEVYTTKKQPNLLTVTSNSFATDILLLCHSLGYRINHKQNDNTHSIYLYEDTYVKIKSITEVTKRDMTCLTVNDDTHTFLIEDYIVTHNTATTLAALYDLNPNHHVLIIAPKNIARSTWLDEIAKWNLPFRTKSFLIDENDKPLGKTKRIKRYNECLTDPPTIYFINRELVCDLIDYFTDKKGNINWLFPTVVIDEAQSFKSYNSKRFKALKKVRPKISRMIELTGTPAPNGLIDIWSQIYLLDGGQRLGTTISRYRENYFIGTVIVNGYPVKWSLRHGAEQAIYKVISDIVISMKNTSLKLPSLTINDVYVYMDAKEKKRYDKFKKDQVLPLANETIIATNAAVLQAKLSQMASGAIYTENGKSYEVIHEKKLEHLEYIIRNATSPVLVAYHFKSDLSMILEYLHQNKHEAVCFNGTTDMIRRWNNKEIPVMCLQPASAGHGLNLQHGGHTLVWYTIPWSLEEYQQTNARLYRQGQTEPVIIHHLLTKHTVDEQIIKAINQKDMTQSQLLEAVKAQL